MPNKIECYECDSCSEVYRSDDDAKSCEKSHANYSDLEIVDVSYKTGLEFPEYMILNDKENSGHCAKYRIEEEGSYEDIEPLRKSVDDSW
jgi:hypothetical protein